MGNSDRLGVVVIGINGAVSSTLVAATKMMVKGLVARRGMLTEPSADGATGGLHEKVDFPTLDNMVFAGWDIRRDNMLQHLLFNKFLIPCNAHSFMMGAELNGFFCVEKVFQVEFEPLLQVPAPRSRGRWATPGQLPVTCRTRNHPVS